MKKYKILLADATVMNRDESIVLLAVVFWYSTDPILSVKENISGKKNKEILADQIHHMCQPNFSD